MFLNNFLEYNILYFTVGSMIDSTNKQKYIYHKCIFAFRKLTKLRFKVKKTSNFYFLSADGVIFKYLFSTLLTI